MEDSTQAAIRSTETDALQAKLRLLLSAEHPSQGQSQMAEAVIAELADRILEVAL